jgi:hypothetical protein
MAFLDSYLWRFYLHHLSKVSALTEGSHLFQVVSPEAEVINLGMVMINIQGKNSVSAPPNVA